MGNSDASIYDLRYNLISASFEGAQGKFWTPLSMAGMGVTAITADGGSSTTGIVNFVSGTNVSLVQVGQDITINSGGVTSFKVDFGSATTGQLALVSGTGIMLSQIGQAVTVNAIAGGSNPVLSDNSIAAGGNITAPGMWHDTSGTPGTVHLPAAAGFVGQTVIVWANTATAAMTVDALSDGILSTTGFVSSVTSPTGAGYSSFTFLAQSGGNGWLVTAQM